jgi:oligopeptide transport system substrate-binding protein
MAAAVGISAVALLAAACGGGGEPTSQGTGQGGGEISINGCTPENPLVPGNTSEVCGGNVLDGVTAKLVYYKTEDASPQMDLAESIETEDNQTFTVKLATGRKFHDGTEVLAKNFVDAWNYNANGENGYTSSYFFTPIEGYADVQCGVTAEGEPDCEGKPPKAETMSGLEVVDDHTFTIKTTEKVSNLPVRLGYTAFAPYPDSFFDDPEAYGKKPIGAGAFQFDSRSETEMVLTKFADYSGPQPAKVDKITFKIYTDQAAAYADVVAGSLDILDNIPPDQMVGDQYQSDLPERNATKETGGFKSITFSPEDEQLKDNPDLRKAISMAINREEIAQQVLSGAAVPATSWVSPVVDGAVPDTCGEACVFDAAKAKALYEKAGGYEGTLTYTTNTAEAAENGQVGEAVCNQLKNNLGLDCKLNNTGDFATFNAGQDAGDYKGIWRSGWQMDYPSIENFLAPLYGRGADSNKAKYDSDEFNKLLAEAAAAEAGEPSNTKYQEAEAVLAEDFPVAPMFFDATNIGWSDRMAPVEITAFGTPDLFSASLK